MGAARAESTSKGAGRAHRSGAGAAARAALAACCCLALGLALTGCASEPASGSDDASDLHAGETVTLTGALHSGAVAIGGETTGWILRRKGEPDLEVDVTNIRTQAEAIGGLLVRIKGRIEYRNSVERGHVPVLVAQRIDLAS